MPPATKCPTPRVLQGAALLVPDVPALDGTRDTPDQVTPVEDRSIFTDLAPDEHWIPDTLVTCERQMVLSGGALHLNSVADRNHARALDGRVHAEGCLHMHTVWPY